MDRPATLSASFVRTVKRPGRYGDGRGSHGLSLLVKPTTNGRYSKTWSQRLRINGHPVMIGLGAYPVVSLADAREKALENRRALAQGKDPRRSRAIPTFEQAAEAVIALRADTWRDGGRTADIWRSSLERFVYPQVGAKRVNEVTSGDVMRVLLPIWNDKRATATKLKSRIGGVMKWAIAQGHRADNPAGDAIAAALPRTGGQQTHHRALPHHQVGDALAAVRDSDAWAATKLAFEYLVLTATRSGEVRGARWDEIDLESETWTVPGDRTKTGKPHRVPLSNRALDVLADATAIVDESGLLFPSPTGRHLSDATMSKLLKEHNIGAVPHGFRSSFRSWCADTGVPREVAEAALGHTVAGVEGAYQRSDLLETRRHLMDDWGGYITIEPPRAHRAHRLPARTRSFTNPQSST